MTSMLISFVLFHFKLFFTFLLLCIVIVGQNGVSLFMFASISFVMHVVVTFLYLDTMSGIKWLRSAITSYVSLIIFIQMNIAGGLAAPNITKQFNIYFCCFKDLLQFIYNQQSIDLCSFRFVPWNKDSFVSAHRL